MLTSLLVHASIWGAVPCVDPAPTEPPPWRRAWAAQVDGRDMALCIGPLDGSSNSLFAIDFTEFPERLVASPPRRIECDVEHAAASMGRRTHLAYVDGAGALVVEKLGLPTGAQVPDRLGPIIRAEAWRSVPGAIDLDAIADVRISPNGRRVYVAERSGGGTTSISSWARTSTEPAKEPRWSVEIDSDTATMAIAPNDNASPFLVVRANESILVIDLQGSEQARFAIPAGVAGWFYDTERRACVLAGAAPAADVEHEVQPTIWSLSLDDGATRVLATMPSRRRIVFGSRVIRVGDQLFASDDASGLWAFESDPESTGQLRMRKHVELVHGMFETESVLGSGDPLTPAWAPVMASSRRVRDEPRWHGRLTAAGVEWRD